MNSSVAEVIPISSSLRLSGDALLEPLAGSQLALWSDGQLKIGDEVAFGSVRYKTAEIDKGLKDGLRLPSRIDVDVDAQALLHDLETFFSTEVGLQPSEALLLSAVVLSSWVNDALANPLWVHLMADESLQPMLLSVMAGIVRNPLRLADISVKEMTTLPSGLRPTLLLSNSRQRTVHDVFQATGTSILRAGKLHLIPLCMVITCSDGFIAKASLQIPITVGTRRSSLTQSRLQQMEGELRPKLLGYRLRYLAAIEQRACSDDWLVCRLRGAEQLMPVTLSAGSEPTARLIRALEERDRDRKMALSESDTAYVLEALIVSCHEQRESVGVQELAELTNLILQGRKERHSLSAKGVGAILRDDLMLTPHREKTGYVLDLTSDVIQRVHECADGYGCLPALWQDRDCDACDAIRRDQELFKHAFSAGGVDNVHQVHQVHDVHQVHQVHDVHQVHSAAPPAGETPSHEIQGGGL